METKSEDEKDRTRRSLLSRPYSKLLFAMVITGAFYIDLWDGSLPPLSEPVIIGVAVVIGAVVGLLTVSIGDTDQSKRARPLPIFGFFIVVMMATLVAPVDLPVAVEVGLLASFWGSAVGSTVLSSESQ